MKKEFFLAISFFFLAVFIFFSKPIIHHLSIVPAETIYYMDNNYKTLISEVKNLPGNGILSDLVIQMYPWRHFIAESFANNIFPLWNPYSLGGLPFLANSQSSIFEITKLFSYIFHISAINFMLFSSFFTLFLGGIFTYLFSRNLKISQSSSLTSGIVFMLSGPVIVWLGYPLTSVAIWLPMLLLCVDKITQKTSKKWAALFALSIGFQFFAGNPEMSWFLLFTTACYAIFRLCYYRKDLKLFFKKGALLITSLILGLALASVQIAPTLEFLKQSGAFSEGRGGLAKQGFLETISTGAWNSWHSWPEIKFSLENFTLMSYPNYFGNTIYGQQWGPGNFNELALYIGIIPFIFSVFTLISLFDKKEKRKEIIFFASIGFVCFAAFANFPIFRLLAYLPIFKIVAIGRLRYIFVFCFAILAGYGFDYFHRRNLSLKKIAIFNSLYTAIAFLIYSRHQKTTPAFALPKIWNIEISLLLTLFIITNIAFLIIFLSKKNLNSYKKTGIALLVILIAGELFSYGYNYHPAFPAVLAYPKTSGIRFLQENIENYRFTSYRKNFDNYTTSLPPDTSLLWNLQDARGYEIIKVKRYEEIEKYLGSETPFIYKNFDHKIFNLLGVKYFMQGKDATENAELQKTYSMPIAYTNEAVNIYENKEVLPRAFISFNIQMAENCRQALNAFLENSFDPKKDAIIESENTQNVQISNSNISIQKADITKYSLNEVEITADISRNGFLVLTDSYYPGWQAFIDGKETEIFPANIAFRGIYIPAGNHKIIFKYHPKSFFYSIYISIFSLFTIILMIIYPLKKKKR